MDINRVTGKIIDAAMKVHSALGPGLLESAYEACLLHELRKSDLRALSQAMLPLHYDGVKIDAGYRIDLLVADSVIVELKAVDKVFPIHMAQLLSYLKLSDKKVGLLINFNVVHLKSGIKRIANKVQCLADGRSSFVAFLCREQRFKLLPLSQFFDVIFLGVPPLPAPNAYECKARM